MPVTQPASSPSGVAIFTVIPPDSAPWKPPDPPPPSFNLADQLSSLVVSPIGPLWASQPPPLLVASPPTTRITARASLFLSCSPPATSLISKAPPTSPLKPRSANAPLLERTSSLSRTKASDLLLVLEAQPCLSASLPTVRFSARPALRLKSSMSPALTFVTDLPTLIESPQWWLESPSPIRVGMKLVEMNDMEFPVPNWSLCYGTCGYNYLSGFHLVTALCRIFITPGSLSHKDFSLVSEHSYFAGWRSFAALCRNLLGHRTVQALRCLWGLSVAFPPLPPVPPDPPDLLMIRAQKLLKSDSFWVYVHRFAVLTLSYSGNMSITTALIISASTPIPLTNHDHPVQLLSGSICLLSLHLPRYEDFAPLPLYEDLDTIPLYEDFVTLPLYEDFVTLTLYEDYVTLPLYEDVTILPPCEDFVNLPLYEDLDFFMEFITPLCSPFVLNGCVAMDVITGSFDRCLIASIAILEMGICALAAVSFSGVRSSTQDFILLNNFIVEEIRGLLQDFYLFKCYVVIIHLCLSAYVVVFAFYAFMAMLIENTYSVYGD